MLDRGEITANDFAWTEGLSGWQALSSLLPPEENATASPSPSSPKRLTPAQGLLVLVAAIVGAIIDHHFQGLAAPNASIYIAQIIGGTLLLFGIAALVALLVKGSTGAITGVVIVAVLTYIIGSQAYHDREAKRGAVKAMDNPGQDGNGPSSLQRSGGMSVAPPLVEGALDKSTKSKTKGSQTAIAQRKSAEIHAVSVGGRTISLPSPDGFLRYDGKSIKVDSLQQQFVPPNNRLLAAFGPEETLADVLPDEAPAIDRQFSAQCERSLESIGITPAVFAQVKLGLRKILSANIEDHGGLVKQVEKNAARAVGTNLTIGDVIPLGSFDETNHSLCFSVRVKAQLQTGSDSHSWTTAECIVQVADRALYLTASSPYRDKSDIDWAQQNIQRWRDAVLGANTQ